VPALATGGERSNRELGKSLGTKRSAQAFALSPRRDRAFEFSDRFENIVSCEKAAQQKNVHRKVRIAAPAIVLHDYLRKFYARFG